MEPLGVIGIRLGYVSEAVMIELLAYKKREISFLLCIHSMKKGHVRTQQEGGCQQESLLQNLNMLAPQS